MEGFEELRLNEEHVLYKRHYPAERMPTKEEFAALWTLHPPSFPTLTIHGRSVQAPRWQQAYGVDYVFSGQTNHAQPIPDLLLPYLRWCQEHIAPELNGLLLNWYDGAQGHYIGKHRDSNHQRVPNSHIVTLSLGEERTLRMRPWRQKGFTDFVAENGSIFVIPWNTNLAWTHEIPASRRTSRRRISLTFRAFER